ncbi:MAG: long-chain fatty acid--CoA ligase [Acidimicrobiia bacterium]|nr:long-chain fatty acid--CoA ligase [Acidimicrobiia bacterium]
MAETIIGLFNDRAGELGEKPALITYLDGKKTVRTWADYSAEVRALARALASEGVGQGDAVAVLSGNRAEYHIIDLATLACGGVAVPIYHSNSPEQVQYVLDHSEAKVVFVEDADQLAKVVEIRGNVPSLKRTVTLTSGAADTTYAEMREKGEELDAADPDAYVSACGDVQPEDLACLIYTSGTTGPPKGAMLTHANVVWTADSLRQILDLDNAVFLSFLPLAHIAERMVSHYNMINLGGETWFGGGIDTLRDDLAACRPTVFFAVPRVFEKFEVAMKAKFAEMEGVQATLVKAAVGVGTRVVEAHQANRSPGLLDRITHPLLDKVVLSKLRHQVGFDRLEAAISGAAPITRETLVFFHAVGIPIAEVYGQTEDCGPTSLNPPSRIKIGTVGPPIPGCQVEIADDGEILVKGGNVFKGYYKNEESTAETLEDGWLHSGDLGELDADGYLVITGRKKDLIITAGGKNISPQNIESSLKADPYISQAVVIGDRRKFLSALITLDAEAVAKFADAHGIEGDAAQSDEVKQLVEAAVEETNSQLSKVEQIKKYEILPEDFSQERGEVTPTLKVRRHKIEDRYGDVIESMYA